MIQRPINTLMGLVGVMTTMDYVHDYQYFFEEAPIALFRTDIKTGKFLLANRACAELLGYSNVEELIEKERSTNLYEEKDQRRKLINKIRKHGNVEGDEVAFTLSNGKKVWVEAYLHISCGGTCIEGSLIDVTLRKEMEEQIRAYQLRYLDEMNEISEQIDHSLVNLQVGICRSSK
jgi:PAS domain S-box-containing protein